MSVNVITSFQRFLNNKVNLSKEETDKARASRNWLIEQINAFPEKITQFPKLYTDHNINYGSFARRTKIRPLDDIDIMICLSAEGAKYSESGAKTTIEVSKNHSLLNQFCNEGTNLINSIKIINKFIWALKQVPQYKDASIKRNQEAATLELNSYNWVFDIVPCFYTNCDNNGNSYYFIPDGKGAWKKTNPKLDQEKVTQINQDNNGNVLNFIRIIKYWNKFSKLNIPSYLLETIVLNYCEQKSISQFVDLDLPGFFGYIASSIFPPVYDHKGIQGDINCLTNELRNKISKRAYDDKRIAEEARSFETENYPACSIETWCQILGVDLI
ncbi:MAG: nucleotidyltransferase [Legionella sp.]|uniref:nucleotidyltransferase n=1 Tax=Legionella sp. TaxID=459 RepID=UPI00284214F1|nr:nucleotidyltransferase [Legionella sp.]